MTVSNISNECMLYEGFLPGLPAKNIVAFQAGPIFACYTGAQISGKRLDKLDQAQLG